MENKVGQIDFSNHKQMAEDCWLFLTNDKKPDKATIKKEAFLHEVGAMIKTAASFASQFKGVPIDHDITLTYKDYSAQGRTVQEAVKLLCELVEALPIEQEGEVLKDFSTELAIRLFQPFKDNDYSDLQKLSDRIAKEIGKIQFTIKRKSLEQEGEKIKKAIGFVGNKISEYEALIENNFKGLSMNPYVHEMRELNEVHNYLQSLITE